MPQEKLAKTQALLTQPHTRAASRTRTPNPTSTPPPLWIMHAGTHRPRDTSFKGHIIQGTHHSRDTSFNGHIIQRTHHSTDTSFNGHIIQGTHHSRDTSFKGHIIQGTHRPGKNVRGNLVRGQIITLHLFGFTQGGGMCYWCTLMMRPSASLVLHRYILVISNLH